MLAVANLLGTGKHLLAMDHDHRVSACVPAQEDLGRCELLELAGREVLDRPRPAQREAQTRELQTWFSSYDNL